MPSGWFKLVSRLGFRRQWRGLVVDDQQVICRVTAMALSALGGQITTARDGAEAVETVLLAEQCGIGFDLVLTDIQMPVMDGIEAARRMRDKGFKRPIVATSAAADAQTEDRCLAAGCNEFISKPATFEELKPIVLRYCKDWIP